MNELHAQGIDKRVTEARQQFCQLFRSWRATQGVTFNRIASLSLQVSGRRRLSSATILRIERAALDPEEAEKLRPSFSMFVGIGEMNRAILSAMEGRIPLGVRPDAIRGLTPFCGPDGIPLDMGRALLLFYGCLEADPTDMSGGEEFAYLACLTGERMLGRTVEAALRRAGKSLLDVDDVLRPMPGNTTFLRSAIFGGELLTPTQVADIAPDLAHALSLFTGQEISVDTLISLCEELEGASITA